MVGRAAADREGGEGLLQREGLPAPDLRCLKVRTAEKQGWKEWVRGRRLSRTEMGAMAEGAGDRLSRGRPPPPLTRRVGRSSGARRKERCSAAVWLTSVHGTPEG